MKTLVINLNFLFDERNKDKLFEVLADFQLQVNVRTLKIEDSMITQRNLDCLTQSDFAQQIVSLKLPRNNLGDQGVA